MYVYVYVCVCDQVDPFLSVKTPRRELVSLSGSALYNQDKIIKADMALNLLNFKPASAQCESPSFSRYYYYLMLLVPQHSLQA